MTYRLSNIDKLWFQCQRYNLKAIHTQMFGFDFPELVVVPVSKIQSADFKIIM